MDDLSLLDATAQAKLVKTGDVSALELVDASIERIEALNPDVNAVIYSDTERARAAAAGHRSGQSGYPTGTRRSKPGRDRATRSVPVSLDCPGSRGEEGAIT